MTFIDSKPFENTAKLSDLGITIITIITIIHQNYAHAIFKTGLKFENAF